MKRFLFVSDGILPIVAFAEDKRAFRVYVRQLLGMPSGMPLPRHCVASIA